MASNEDTSEDDFARALQLSCVSNLPMAMNATIELKLLDIISRAGKGAHISAEQIASQLPTKNPRAPEMVDRILRLLASHSILTCTNSVNELEGDKSSTSSLYGLAPIAKYYLDNEGEMSLAPLMLFMHDKAHMDAWYALKDGVLEGGVPFDKIHGMNVFEYAAKSPKFNEIYNKAMINLSGLLMEKILEKYKGFENIEELVDVGGGLGHTLQIITSKYPNIKPINFDLPHVIQYSSTTSSFSGVQHMSGDMFLQIPKGETILLKFILHNWNDECCLRLLKNCYAALPDDGKIIVIEKLVPETVDTTTSTKDTFQVDVTMLVQTSGGKERTRAQYESLATKAGFRGLKLQCEVYTTWVIEIYK